jgi:hypothetical protein
VLQSISSSVRSSQKYSGPHGCQTSSGKTKLILISRGQHGLLVTRLRPYFICVIAVSSLVSVLPEGMILFVFSALVFVPWNGVFGGQIPVVGGTPGCVPASPPSMVKGPQSQQLAVTTPGKLRVVENSGICGRLVHFSKLPFVADNTFVYHFRDNSWRISSLRLWRSNSHRKYLVCAPSIVLTNAYTLTISFKGFGFLQPGTTRIQHL